MNESSLHTNAWQTPAPLPDLDIPSSSWLHFVPGASGHPGDVVFCRVHGSVCVGRIAQGDRGEILFRDGSSGAMIEIKRPQDLQTYGVVVQVTREFA